MPDPSPDGINGGDRTNTGVAFSWKGQERPEHWGSGRFLTNHPTATGLGRESVDGVLQQSIEVAGVMSTQATILLQTNPVEEGLGLEHRVCTDDWLVSRIFLHVLNDTQVNQHSRCTWPEQEPKCVPPRCLRRYPCDR